ncbi:ISAs1 family transposase [Spirosoma utsteinense]|uniref:Transposase YbfD/YdcC n=2 Tax=Spirosoma utsteinense TaxID=2585773 RepID=A0ABR6WFP2_9BACT|nr:ISAs1 family transposase [Spirosoma utsteinense]MBC3795376.1 putative transposase YbfD/YdcC [Spirosoma utsteinense]
MTPFPCQPQNTSFFQLLKQTPQLDGRDSRGKYHCIALVITGLTLALCCGRDGNLSSLHRHMANHFDDLCRVLQLTNQRVVSRPQLPRLLAKVNGIVFADLLFQRFGLVLTLQQQAWFALDGKELRGSIEPANKRGQACVSVVAHRGEAIAGQAYYNGTKESERPVATQLLADTGMHNQKITLDALHLIPLTIKTIHEKGGLYLVGLKANQQILYRPWVGSSSVKVADYDRADKPERGHGRIAQRSYSCFAMNRHPLALRWQTSGMQTLVRVVRVRQSLAGLELSRETSYFVSNALVNQQGQADELFDAVRQHWRIETMHHRRDVSLSEDRFRSSQAAVSRLLSNLRSIVLNVLGQDKVKNMVARMEEFADKFHVLLQFMTLKNVL